MTRGKNSAKTANRERAIAEREAPLRRRIAHLEAELEKAEQRNREMQAVHTEATANMRRLMAANTSERVEELEASLADTKQLLETTETARVVVADAFHRLADALQDSFEAMGIKPVDAHERKLRIAKVYPSFINEQTPGFVKTDDVNSTVGLKVPFSQNLAGTRDPERITRLHRLQRAKGLRS